MSERSKNVTIAIFLFSIFVFLGIMIFVFSYSAARNSANFSKETTKSSLECTGVTFDIVEDSISYENKNLEFTIASFRNTPTLNFIIAAGNQTRKIRIDFNVMPTAKKTIKDIEITDKFRIYPEGCEAYNMKECNLTGCVRLR